MKTLVRSLMCVASLSLYASFASALNFEVRPLTMDEQQMLKDQKYWMPGCPVPLDRLRVVETGYIGLDDQEAQGALVVLDAVAPDTLEAFRALYAQKFPITKPVIVETPDMQDKYGYTLGFVCKPITAGTVWSLHSYGTALVMTPFYNPYLGFFHFEHQQMTAKTLPMIDDVGYFDRTMSQTARRFFVDHVESVFTGYGWTVWGGRWTDPIDYMNFNIPRWVSAMMVMMNAQDGQLFFQLYKQYSHYLDQFTDSSFGKAYVMYPRDFISALDEVLAAASKEEPPLSEKVVLARLMSLLAQRTANDPVPPGLNAGLGFDDSTIVPLFSQENKE